MQPKAPALILSMCVIVRFSKRQIGRKGVMRTIAKLAIGAAMACGAAVAATAPAAAQVGFGIGVAPPYVAPAPVCYDAYGNYIYSYPYCTAYPDYYVAPPVIAPYFGFGIGGGFGHDHFVGGRGFAGGGHFAGGHMATSGGHGGGHHRG